MKVEELLKPFPIKEFHPFPRAMMGLGRRDGRRRSNEAGVQEDPGDDARVCAAPESSQNMGESLKYHGLEVVLYDQVESNPKDYNVMDSVEAVPGGEVRQLHLDRWWLQPRRLQGCPHLGRARRSQRQRLRGLQQSENPKNPPHIAISTTGGTGSETSWAYVITDTTTDPNNPHKYVGFDDAAVATLAIDDPVRYYTCPLDYTAQCGFDVLAHASEPYVSRLNFEPSLGNAIRAIKLTAENLRQAAWNAEDLAGREGMMYAQYIAAQAFNSGGLGIIHSISHAVSAFYDTHHGLNNAIALPRVWAFNMPVAYKRFADIAQAMGVDTHGMTDVQAADAALAAGIRLLRDVEHPRAVHRRQAGQLLQEPARSGPDEVLRERPGHQGRQGRCRPHHQPRPR